MGAPLEIRLIGEIGVRRDGVALALPASKKTRALLGYLAVTGRPQRRDRLCALLWDGPDDPRAALRWSLTKLRPVLDDPGEAGARLIADRDHVELVANGAVIDLATIRAVAPGGTPGAVARATTEELARAAPLVRGDLLEGLELRDCYRWDEWCRGEREALRRVGIAILMELVGRLRETAPADALEHARAWVGQDPLSEAAHAAVIDLLARSGRRAEAMAQYASCERLLERELARRPSRELERLRMAMAAAGTESGAAAAETGAAAPPAVVTRTTPVMPARLPLIGRAQERAILQDAVATGTIVVVLGDPGIGKSRMLEELAAIARAAGSVVVSGRGIEAEMVRPYGAWLDALAPLIADGASPFAAATGADADRAQMFEAVATWLAERAATVTVILDDIQWLDDGSAALFHFIARRGTTIRLACAARPGELADNPAAVKLLRGLARGGQVRQIGLSPLDASATAALAAAHAPGVDTARVVAESGGHPLFAVEIARALARGDTSWSSLDGLLGERLDLLDGAAREVVPWAAALGRAFAPALLATIAGMSLADLSRAVDELERRAVLRAAGTEWDFAHDLLRVAAYQRVSEPRRRLLHLQIARVLDATRDDAIAGEVAHHAALGGDDALCARASVTAGKRALRMFAHEEAAELADRALPHAARLVGAERVELQVTLLQIAGNADRRGVRRASIIPALERAIVDAQAAGFHAEAAHGINVLARIHYDAGALQDAIAGAVDAIERSRGGDPGSQARALAHSAQCFVMIGREMARATALATEAAELAARSGVEIGELAFALAMVRHHQGDDDAAIALLHRARELFTARGDHYQCGAASCRAAMIEVRRHRPRAALDRCAEASAIAERMGEGGELALAVVVEAIARFALAPDDAAAGAIEAALIGLRAADARALLACGLNCAADVELTEGWTDAADRHATEALAVATRARRDNEIVVAHASLARIAQIRRDPAAARGHIEELRRIPLDELGAQARTAIAAAGGAPAQFQR